MATLLLAAGISQAGAYSTNLFDWAFNVNGEIYQWGDELPDTFDDESFDWDTGMGTLSILIDPGMEGDFYFLSWFNHDIDILENGFLNEYGEAVGSPAAGQSWEIASAGARGGNIWSNFSSGFLDNQNDIPPGSVDDVNLAMGWNFTLEQDQHAMISLVLGEEIPDVFYLRQTDPDSPHAFNMHGNVFIGGGSDPVPEPGTFLLVCMGMAGMVWARRFVA